jgi:large subunit ribosomal protein L19
VFGKSQQGLLCAGVEMFYEMYSPIIQKIEVLRLEKRLDNELLYLRDALPEYSTFPLDMEPEYLPEGAPIPVNPIKVSNATIIKH